MEQHVFSVTEVNQYIKSIIDGVPQLGDLLIRGELSNYKVYPSGHHYFTLKDGESAIRCVMFRSSAGRLRFRPESGMQVIAGGRISVYPRDGAYQLYCTSLSADGIGDLYVAFEQLKDKLNREGLFDPAHKKPLPPYPRRIAIVTSSAGAAVHDMIRILRRRYPIAKVLLLPVRVQGVEAPPEIVGAIRYANRWQLADVLIVGRGGGSIEDLWAFNDERVARAIYASEIPVISAVGHEPDVTISDFVADRRASTPSNAAEIAGPRHGAGCAEYAGKGGRPVENAGVQAGADRPHGLCGRPADAVGQRAAAYGSDSPPAAEPAAAAVCYAGGVAGRPQSAEGAGPGLCHGTDYRRHGAANEPAGTGRRQDTRAAGAGRLGLHR